MKLTAKILLLGLLPLVIGGSAVLFVGFEFHRRTLLQEADERAQMQLEHSTEVIRSFFGAHVTSLTVLSATRELREGSLPGILNQLGDWQPKLEGIEALYYSRLDGFVHDAAGRVIDVSDRSYYPAVLRGETVITEALDSRATGETIVLVIVPVFGLEGRLSGALGASVRISRLIEMVRDIRVGEAGFAILVDARGRVIAAPHAERDASDAALGQALLRPTTGPIHLQLGGEPCRMHCRRVPSTDWTLAMVEKEADTLDSVNRAALYTLTLFGGTCLLAALMGLLVRSQLSAPIRRLMEVQRRIAAGEGGARVEVFSDDELGELSKSFNRMADALDTAQARLREREAGLSRLFHFAPVAIGTVGRERTILVINDEAVEMFGYDREELIGQSTRTLYPSDAEYERVGRALYEEVRQKGSATVEARLRRKDGREFQAQVSMAPQRAEEPSDTWVVVIQDITERKEAEDALREGRDEMAALNRLTRAVTSQTDLEAACHAAIRTIAELLDVEMVLLFLREGEDLHLRACGPALWSHPVGEAGTHRVGECLCGLAVQTGQAQFCRNIHDDTRCTWDECRSVGIRSFAAIPLRLGGDVIGVLGVASRTERDFQQRARLLETASDQLAMSVHIARLLEQTRAYAAELEQEVRRREEVEEALRRNERRLSMAISATADAIWEWRPTSQEAYFSPRWYEMLGYSEQDLSMSFEFWSRLCHPDDYASVMEHIHRVLESSDTVGYEVQFRMRAKDDSWVWILGRGNVVERDAEGRPLLLSGTHMDITERKLAEEALTASRHLLHKVISNAPVILTAMDRDGAITLSDGKGLAAVGLGPGELVGESLFRRFKNYPVVIDHVRRVLAGEEFSEIVQIRGKVHEVHYSPLINANGEVEGATSIALDVTERRLAERKLIESEAAYRTLFEQSPFAIAVNRPSGVIVDVNAKFCDSSGLSREVVQGKTAVELGIVDEREAAAMLKAFADRGDRLDGYELTITQPGTGDRRFGLIWVRMIQIHGESLIISMVNDITERKEEETQRKRLEDQLMQAQKMEAIGRLAGGIAHDFNNILSAIVGYSELARMELAETTRAKSFIGEVLKASERARDLVQQILVFSRQSEEQPQPTLVAPVVKEALKLLRASIPSTIDIRQSIRTRDTVVLADPTRIHQIVMNLCTNAYHAMMDSGGTLTVSTEEIQQGPGLPALDPDLPDGSYFVLTVSDSGCGIPLEDLDKIFDPYFTTKEKGKGTGLGLAVVRGIAERFGGKVQATSSMGAGSTFRVLLPSIQTRVGQHAQQEAPFARGSERILFVDDEATLVLLGKDLFEGLGYQVVAVSSSLEAFERFSRRPLEFDLVITDFTMPGLTGGALAQRILQIRPDMPIILCTGQGDQFSEEDSRASGITEYVRKPFKLADLSILVRKVLDERQERGKDMSRG